MYIHALTASFFTFCVLLVKADQQSKASTSHAPSATTGGEAMDITTPGDVAKILVSKANVVASNCSTIFLPHYTCTLQCIMQKVHNFF